MKLKDIVQIAVLTVIGFAVGMVVSMFTGTLGAIALRGDGAESLSPRKS